MKKRKLARGLPLLFGLSVIAVNYCSAQAGINATGASPATSAGLDVDFNNKGLLIPRIELTSTASASPVTTPDTSLVIYNTATAGDVTPGFYFWDGDKWNRFSTGSSASASPCYTCTGF